MAAGVVTAGQKRRQHRSRCAEATAGSNQAAEGGATAAADSEAAGADSGSALSGGGGDGCSDGLGGDPGGARGAVTAALACAVTRTAAAATPTPLRQAAWGVAAGALEAAGPLAEATRTDGGRLGPARIQSPGCRRPIG